MGSAPGRGLALAASVVVAAALVVGCSQETPSTMSGLPYTEFAHQDEPFAEDLFDEQAHVAQVDDDELAFIPGEQDGTYTHVRDLARRSYEPDAEPVLEVWFFGGSTLFGIGQRDEHTIPSEIARLAEADGIPIRVRNFGFPSYESWQEVGLLRRALQQRPAPDLVVFYHGANDYAALCRRLALGTDPYEKGTALFRESPARPEVACDAQPDETGRLTAAVTGRRVEEARELVGKTPIVEFWQPFASTRRPTPTDRPLLDRLHTRRRDMDAQAEAYRSTFDHLDRPVVDLTDAMDGTDEPVYFDYAHTNELGARLVSEAMWERSLRDELRGLASGTS